MPISQATILAIYGDLCDLVEKIETLHHQAFEPGLFSAHIKRGPAIDRGIENLLASAKDIHQQAIVHMLKDEPQLEMNPITGRIDE